jgi:hypothetical protein
VAIDWSGTPPSEVEPLVEIASIHGNSEAMEGPGAIYSPAPGHFARDALARGLPLGFLGGGDTHDGHPGLGHLASRQGGLVAVLDAEHSPAGILAALRSRRVYATNGARILLLTSLDGRSMGAEVPAAPAGKLVIFAVGTAPIAAAVVVRSGAEVQRIPGQGKALLEASLDLADLAPGEHLYVRVEQEDGGLAWSSPLRVGPPTGSAP